MGRLFSIDNPVMAYLRKLKDWIVLSILWVLCSVPIITVGAATAALYYVTLKMVKHEDLAVVRSFFKAFKDNLKQGIPLALILLICGGVLCVDCVYFSGFAGAKGIILSVIFYSLTASFLCMAFYVFPFQAQFSNTIPGILKSAAYLAARNLSSTIWIVLLNILPVLVRLLSWEVFMRMLPLWVCVAPAAIAYMCAMRFVKIFAPVIKGIEDRQSEAAAETR